MSDEREDELTAEQQQGLAGLRRAVEPPAELEQRVVGELVARGMIRRRPGWGRVAAAAAVLLLAVALGYAAGWRAGAARAGGPATPDAAAGAVTTGPESGAPGARGPAGAPSELSTFALLVYDPVTGLPPAELDAAVAEASAWAGDLAEAGVLVSAEKLRDEGRRLALRGGEVRLVADFPPPGSAEVLGGFFMIRATGVEEAQRIAEQCPLLRFGSTIEVRAFEDV